MLRTAVSMKLAIIVLDRKIFIVGGVYYQAGMEFYSFIALQIAFQLSDLNSKIVRVELYFATKSKIVVNNFLI